MVIILVYAIIFTKKSWFDQDDPIHPDGVGLDGLRHIGQIGELGAKS